jgi:hypothetical protein
MQTAVVAFWEGRIYQHAELFRVPSSCPKTMLRCGLDMKLKNEEGNPYFTWMKSCCWCQLFWEKKNYVDLEYFQLMSEKLLSFVHSHME